jgi:hypothetical protein
VAHVGEEGRLHRVEPVQPLVERRQLLFAGVEGVIGGAQLCVGLLQLLRPREDFGFDAMRGIAQFGTLALVLDAQLAHAHEPGDVFDAMDDVEELAVGIEHGRVHRAPVALLETAALRRGAGNVVLLHRHRVDGAFAHDTQQRRPEVADARGARIVRVVGKDVEDAAAEHLVSHGIRR